MYLEVLLAVTPRSQHMRSSLDEGLYHEVGNALEVDVHKRMRT